MTLTNQFVMFRKTGHAIITIYDNERISLEVYCHKNEVEKLTKSAFDLARRKVDD